jgi:two-component system, OmpR family, copper resistance phosphate regulon response regulator CusR
MRHLKPVDQSELEFGLKRLPGFPKPGQMKILIVEDDSKTARAIRSGLVAEGYAAVIAKTGDEGMAKLSSEVFDLVLLDWMLPGHDGIEILKSLRKHGNKPPVLLLTARDAVEDRVLGLDSGADDYLVKPFAFAELLARLRVLLRRSGQDEVLRKQVGDLMLDLRTRQSWRGPDEIALTPREFDLLVYLMRHESQVVTRQMLAREVWRETNRSTPLDNVIDVHLARLRKKVDEGRPARLIHTVRGVGFICADKRAKTSEGVRS